MVQIITDSAADLQPQEYDQLGVTCIPLRVAFGDREYLENAELDKERFYELLLGSDEFPKTSQAAPAVLEEILERAKAAEKRKELAKAAAKPAGTYTIHGEGDEAIDALVMARYEAKKAKNFAEADRIRDELKAQGIEVTDVPGGANWKRI